MTCLHPWDIARKPEDGTDFYLCTACKGIYKATEPGCPKVFIKCQRALQVPTARKVG